jgi:hypothetical protein
VAINWDESLPKDSDYYATHAASLRTLESTIAGALGQTMNWPGSGGGTPVSAGSLKPGVARSYFTLQSQFSTLLSSTTVGNTSAATAFTPAAPFFQTSDTSRAFSQNWTSSATSTSGSTATTYNFSGVTLPLGGASVLESTDTSSGAAGTMRCSVSTGMVRDALGTFGTSDTTTLLVSIGTFVNGAWPMVQGTLWLETSLGTQTVRAMSVALSSFDVPTSKAIFTLSVLSRSDSFPTGASVCTAHLLVFSSGTNLLGA